eukprot:SAG22_NODE_1020_length_5999_cov_8.921186_3_plen_146_part_00
MLPLSFYFKAVPFLAVCLSLGDTVDFKEVMAQYKLGPNGGIMTALNLFATRFDQVMGFLEKRASASALKHVLLDTPGQIEVSSKALSFCCASTAARSKTVPFLAGCLSSGLHLVGLRRHHHRDAGHHLPDRPGLRAGHAEEPGES